MAASLLVLALLTADGAAEAVPDAGPRVTNVEFGAEETEEPPELVTSRKETKFGSLLPDRFHSARAAPPATVTSRRRGGCSGCDAGGSATGSGPILVALTLLWRLRRRR